MPQINLKQMENNNPAKNYDKENMARAFGRSLPISFKQSIEICNFIRNKKISYAKNVLRKVMDRKEAIPLKRFNGKVGHKKKMMAGRYPKKASIEILNIINSVEANAQFKGLNTSNLVITRINANKSSKVMHFGRKRSRLSKKTNVDITVQEKAEKKNSDKQKKVKIVQKKETKEENKK